MGFIPKFVALLVGPLLFFLGAACARDEGQRPTLVVSAAISLSDALSVAVAEHERLTSVGVVVNAAGSDTLATQIIGGAAVDVFLSADTRQMDRVQRAGLVKEGSRVDLFSNELVAVVRLDEPVVATGVDDLTSPHIRRVALGDPDSVPAGVYARTYLTTRGVWASVRHKVVPTRSVRAALVSVEAGHADLGFVYRTDLAVTSRLQVAFRVPRAEAPPIIYPGAVLTGTTQAAEARRFLTFLREGAGRRIFEEAGFLLADRPEAS